jgi:hypothetical protein
MSKSRRLYQVTAAEIDTETIAGPRPKKNEQQATDPAAGTPNRAEEPKLEETEQTGTDRGRHGLAARQDTAISI